MANTEKRRVSLQSCWLFCLIAVQPLLDFLAYWNRNSVATAAGYIRLALMVVLPLVLLFRLREKKERIKLLLALAGIGAYCALHVLNCLRLDYMDPFFDISYLAKVAQMPVLTVCFVFSLRDEGTKKQAIRGIWAAAVLVVLGFAAAVLTGTSTTTYAEGIGLSGWVIEDNRCANSIIYVTLSVFAIYAAVRSEKLAVTAAIPAVVMAMNIINGTKACYLGLFAILLGFAAFLLMEKPVLGKKLRGRTIAVLLAAVLLSAVIYPYSPRAKETALMASVSSAQQGEIEATAQALGYDLSAMSLEEILAEPELVDIYAHYYSKYMTSAIPDLFDRFGYEPVIRHFKASTQVSRLIDARQIKLCYSHLLWQQSDTLTKLLGFEVSNIGNGGIRDLENDWPALLYYFGVLGLALYAGFVLYFLYLVLRRLVRDFKGSFTSFNFSLLLCLLLQIGLAQLSGAILRRPNVSIYMAVVLGLIYYQTVRCPAGEESRT